MARGARSDSVFAQRATTFIGRDDALAEVGALLVDRRLITLTGTGGCGKTRLATEVARTVEHDYADGGVFVDLAPVESATLVRHAFASAAGVREEGAATISELLWTALATRQMLVVVDNCERLLDACAELIDGILSRCDGVTVLATSREPLGVEGETTWRVPSLTLPPADTDDPFASLQQCGAGRLLLDRARLARPDMVWSQADNEAAVTICRRLDGIPLALELAASRLRVFSPADVAVAMDDRFRLLNAGPRTAPPRQRTLEASIRWSYDLLDITAQRVLRRLSVFAGRFALDDARAVCACGNVDCDDVWPVLADLVDRSLVQADSGGFRLLETVREYCLLRLREAGEERQIRDCHLEHFIGVAHAFDLISETAELTSANEAIALELDDLRNAMRWSQESGRLTDGLHLAAALRLFWTTAARNQEGRWWIEQFLAADPRTDPLARAHALLASAQLALFAIDPLQQAERATEALAISREHGDQTMEARALVLVGWAKVFIEPVEARTLLVDGRDLGAVVNDEVRVEFASFGCGTAALLCGDLTAAASDLELGLSLARKRTTFGLTYGLGALGFVRLLQGMVDEGLGLLDEATSSEGRDTGFNAALAGQWYSLAQLYRGDYAEGLRRIEEVVSWSRDLGQPTFLALLDACWHHRAAGDHDAVVAALEEAMPVLRFVGLKWYEVQALRLLGDAAAARGDDVGAAEHWRCAVEQADLQPNPLSKTLALIGLAGAHDIDESMARDLLRDAARTALAAGYRIGALDALEALAVQFVVSSCNGDRDSHVADTARTLGALDAERRRIGYVRYPCDRPRYEIALAALRSRLGNEFERTYNEGTSLTIDTCAATLLRGDRRPVRPPSGWASLTPAELRIAQLVSEGLTNPQVGARLFLSRRTVQSHLSHVFAKLEITGRTELAAMMSRRQDNSHGGPRPPWTPQTKPHGRE
ncbi:MAG: LuxR C-terminal-related transcriptional regulator [Actinomycetota bacterium]|nr:LuxR C-terminal-related transcriptional regulator [Actinomycetota bacterium]